MEERQRWRIAVTGIGLVTPLGLLATESASRIRRGEGAVACAPEGGVATASVSPFDIASWVRNPKNIKLMSRSVRMALLATREAAGQARLADAGVADDRVGVYVGSGHTGLEYDEFFKALTLAWEHGREQDYKYLGGMPSRLLDRYFSLRTLSNAGVSALAAEFCARGTSNNYVQGEIASAMAIYTACEDLTEERCDLAIVCGYDSLLHPSTILSFRNMSLLEESFGLIPGEGAGSLILEREEDARARGACVLAVVESAGFASRTADEERLTPRADEIEAATREALNGRTPDFVVARGLGPEPANLPVLAGTPVVTFQRQTGYLGAATAVVEFALGLLTIGEGRGLFLSSNFSGQCAAIVASHA